jgi:membrane glycosyltransferase
MNEQQNHGLPVMHSGADSAASPSLTGEPGQMRIARYVAEDGNFAPSRLVADCTEAIRSLAGDDAGGLARFSSIPEVRRVSMIPRPIDRQPIRRLWRELSRQFRSADAINNNHRQSCGIEPTNDRAVENAWRKKAKRRRVVLALLVSAQTALAIWSLARTFPYPQLSSLELAILAVFSILFSWISFSFWSSMAGFWILWRRVKSVSASRLSKASEDRRPSSRTAVLVPICNEEVHRVFAGIEASYRSLAATGRLGQFDFYFLSDTSDPEQQVEEEFAWARICQIVDGFGKIFYRHRRNNIKRKSGNIADFVRRWGRNYDYMLVFDADSIMAGETMVCLARMMDLHPQVGILQTSPTIVNRESLFARVQQFASRVYGPIFSAGLRFWQLGESYYWGHNAILRVKPFIEHCGLSRLPGRSPFGGDILSHDFVEAALMGRAGWEIWLLDNLPGSFEESPPTILDELKRDRRWCQGNMQHLRLILGDGIRFGHRAIMAIGIMAYVSAFFWALFLILSSAEVAVESLIPPVYFPAAPSLFPEWPQWHPEIAVALLSTTAVMLFLPKILSVLLIVKNREAPLYGGALPLAASVLIEIMISTLFAPIRMWFHSKFVLMTLLGREIKWGSQRRDGAETGWIEALRQHGISMIVGSVWMGGLFWLNPQLAWWVLPVTVPMSLSAAFSVLSSRVSLGAALRQWRLLLIPEEVAPPDVIQRLQESLRVRQAKREPYGFVRVASNPFANAVHIGMLRGKTPKSAKARERNKSLRRKAVVEGPASLGKSEIAQLLFDAEAMAGLHDCRRPTLDPTAAVLPSIDQSRPLCSKGREI